MQVVHHGGNGNNVHYKMKNKNCAWRVLVQGDPIPTTQPLTNNL